MLSGYDRGHRCAPLKRPRSWDKPVSATMLVRHPHTTIVLLYSSGLDDYTLKSMLRNCFHHFPLLFSEGKKFQSHKHMPKRLKNRVIVSALNRRNIRRKRRKQKESDRKSEGSWCFWRSRDARAAPRWAAPASERAGAKRFA